MSERDRHVGQTVSVGGGSTMIFISRIAGMALHGTPVAYGATSATPPTGLEA